MKGSLARRIFRTTLAVGVINVLITLVATELIYEDMEETNLNIGLAQERAYYERQLHDRDIQQWGSALLTVFFVPDSMAGAEIPGLFRAKPIPFAAEVDVGTESYLISIERTADPAGVLYLAQDITVLEDREDRLQEVGILVFAGMMLLLSYFLARLGTGRIVRPLQNLSRQIADIRPGTTIRQIATPYADRELEEIARVLNDLLQALAAYVDREKSLISLASHELRTPITVIAGALDVLEQRNSLGDANSLTVNRIRQATEKMQADVDALLALAHQSPRRDHHALLNLPRCVAAVVAELESSAPHYAGRVSVSCEGAGPFQVQADPNLVHMLLRNLVQNALRHTRDEVFIIIGNGQFSIFDRGAGLPQHIRTRLGDPGSADAVPADGLGLYIVALICERLKWQIKVRHSDQTGTHIDLLYPQA